MARTGRQAVKRRLKDLQREYDVDFTIINGENAAHGKGITRSIYQELITAGADVITLGNHAFSKSDIVPWMAECQNLVRPANMEPESIGRYWIRKECRGKTIAVVNILGGVFMDNALGESYSAMEQLLPEIDADIIIVDLHAEATGEKELFWYLFRKQVTAVIGTHTHVQTADEQVTEGCAYISDAGMCGSFDSVLGRNSEELAERMRGALTRYTPADTPAVICGVLIETDDTSNRAVRITRIQERPE